MVLETVRQVGHSATVNRQSPTHAGHSIEPPDFRRISERYFPSTTMHIHPEFAANPNANLNNANYKLNTKRDQHASRVEATLNGDTSALEANEKLIRHFYNARGLKPSEFYPNAVGPLHQRSTEMSTIALSCNPEQRRPSTCSRSKAAENEIKSVHRSPIHSGTSLKKSQSNFSVDSLVADNKHKKSTNTTANWNSNTIRRSPLSSIKQTPACASNNANKNTSPTSHKTIGGPLDHIFPQNNKQWPIIAGGECSRLTDNYNDRLLPKIIPPPQVITPKGLTAIKAHPMRSETEADCFTRTDNRRPETTAHNFKQLSSCVFKAIAPLKSNNTTIFRKSKAKSYNDDETTSQKTILTINDTHRPFFLTEMEGVSNKAASLTTAPEYPETMGKNMDWISRKICGVEKGTRMERDCVGYVGKCEKATSTCVAKEKRKGINKSIETRKDTNSDIQVQNSILEIFNNQEYTDTSSSSFQCDSGSNSKCKFMENNSITSCPNTIAVLSEDNKSSIIQASSPYHTNKQSIPKTCYEDKSTFQPKTRRPYPEQPFDSSRMRNALYLPEPSMLKTGIPERSEKIDINGKHIQAKLNSSYSSRSQIPHGLNNGLKEKEVVCNISEYVPKENDFSSKTRGSSGHIEKKKIPSTYAFLWPKTAKFPENMIPKISPLKQTNASGHTHSTDQKMPPFHTYADNHSKRPDRTIIVKLTTDPFLKNNFADVGDNKVTNKSKINFSKPLYKPTASRKNAKQLSPAHSNVQRLFSSDTWPSKINAETNKRIRKKYIKGIRTESYQTKYSPAQEQFTKFKEPMSRNEEFHDTNFTPPILPSHGSEGMDPVHSKLYCKHTGNTRIWVDKYSTARSRKRSEVSKTPKSDHIKNIKRHESSDASPVTNAGLLKTKNNERIVEFKNGVQKKPQHKLIKPSKISNRITDDTDEYTKDNSSKDSPMTKKAIRCSKKQQMKLSKLSSDTLETVSMYADNDNTNCINNVSFATKEVIDSAKTIKSNRNYLNTSETVLRKKNRKRTTEMSNIAKISIRNARRKSRYTSRTLPANDRNVWDTETSVNEVETIKSKMPAKIRTNFLSSGIRLRENQHTGTVTDSTKCLKKLRNAVQQETKGNPINTTTRRHTLNLDINKNNHNISCVSYPDSQCRVLLTNPDDYEKCDISRNGSAELGFSRLSSHYHQWLGRPEPRHAKEFNHNVLKKVKRKLTRPGVLSKP